jgi:hypothetical protein
MRITTVASAFGRYSRTMRGTMTGSFGFDDSPERQ